MLGVGPEPWHQRTRLCRQTRVFTCGRVAVAPLLSGRQRALAGDRCTYAPRAIPRCLFSLVGRPWLRGLVGRVDGVIIARRTHQPSAALGFAPLLALLSASLSASSLKASSRGQRHHPRRRPSSMWTPPHQLPCIGPPLSRACASGRRPPPRALMGVIVGFVVARKRLHCPRRRLLSTHLLPLLCCPCVGPLS